MFKKLIFTIIIFSGLLIAAPALAHNPRIVAGLNCLSCPGPDIVQIQNPEISQAFYGQLKGDSQWFEIDSPNSFALYVNILVPKLPNVNTDLIINIFKTDNNPQNLIQKLDGGTYNWTEFYEPFGGDTYLKGPEFRAQEPAGKYLIQVTHCPIDAGAVGAGDTCAFSKFALVVGEKESFPPKEILNAILLLPQLKTNFFNKSAYTAYFNYAGLFMLGALIILAVIVYLIARTIRKRGEGRDTSSLS